MHVVVMSFLFFQFSDFSFLVFGIWYLVFSTQVFSI